MTAPTQNAVCSLGPLKWRIAPSSFDWNYSIDTNVIETLGGQVVQVLGATISDLSVTGYFGQDRATKQESWRLAKAFHQKIQSMMDAQVLPQSAVKIANAGGKVGITNNVHQPWPFSYRDAAHNWDFKVLIKGIAELDGDGSLEHRTGKFSYGYRLTLFVVESGTDQLTQIAKDDFIARLSKGLGWKQSTYNGKLDAQQLQAFIQAAGAPATAYASGLVTGGSQ